MLVTGGVHCAITATVGLRLLIALSKGRFWPRVCKNACAVLKSALLRKICWCLCNQQTRNLRRNAIIAPAPTVKRVLKRFYTASAVFCLSWLRNVQVKSDANGWSGRLQMGGQVSAITQQECDLRLVVRTLLTTHFSCLARHSNQQHVCLCVCLES